LQVRRLIPRRRGLALVGYRHAATQHSALRHAGVGPNGLAGEVWETALTVVVQIEIPGASLADMQVSFSRGRIRIRGIKRRIVSDSQDRTYHLKERVFGRLERSIKLPLGVDGPRTEISYRDGVLTIIVPKLDATPPTNPSRESIGGAK
jgi:HSP20 family molecular chaperone IbpA